RALAAEAEKRFERQPPVAGRVPEVTPLDEWRLIDEAQRLITQSERDLRTGFAAAAESLTASTSVRAWESASSRLDAKLRTLLVQLAERAETLPEPVARASTETLAKLDNVLHSLLAAQVH